MARDRDKESGNGSGKKPDAPRRETAKKTDATRSGAGKQNHTASKANSKAGSKAGAGSTAKASAKTESTSGKRTAKNAGKNEQSRKSQWLAAFVLALVLIMAVPLTIFGVKYAQADLPQPGEMETAQVSTIFANDGATQLARIVPAEGNREQIPLDEVPEHVQDAVLAAEDRD